MVVIVPHLRPARGDHRTMLIGVRFTFVGQGLPAAVVALVPRRLQTTAIVQTSPPSSNAGANGSWDDTFTFIMESKAAHRVCVCGTAWSGL